jgi:dTDP-glucose 4,6-dehydratase
MTGRVLLTGGAGFMGSTVARAFLREGWEVVVFDLLTYAGSRAHLDGVDCSLIEGDVCNGAVLWPLVRECELVVHMAAETHVERSLRDPSPFVRTNVDGTRQVLEACVAAGNRSLVHISTDEVFGSAAPGQLFAETDRFRPGNPYAATKVAAESLLTAWDNSFGLRARLVRCTNNYGVRQHAEKAVPGWIDRGLRGEALPLHGRGEAVRDWLHVDDFARGLLSAVQHDGPRRVFHFAGRNPRTNREMAGLVAGACGGVPLVEVEDRRGQDARYALDDEATRRDLGWAPEIGLEQGVTALVEETRRRWSA